jgi:hypothetical protein
MFGLGLILIQENAVFLNDIYKFFFVMEIIYVFCKAETNFKY